MERKCPDRHESLCTLNSILTLCLLLLFRSWQDSGATFRGLCQKRRHALFLALQDPDSRLLQQQHPGFPQQPNHFTSPLLLQRKRCPVRPSGHGKVHWPLADEGRDGGEQEVEGVDTCSPHAMPPRRLPLYAGEILELPACFSLRAERETAGGVLT